MCEADAAPFERAERPPHPALSPKGGRGEVFGLALAPGARREVIFLLPTTARRRSMRGSPRSASPGRPMRTRRCSRSRKRRRCTAASRGGAFQEPLPEGQEGRAVARHGARRPARRPDGAVEGARRAAVLVRIGGAAGRDARRHAGSVTPFAVMNDAAGKVRLVLDAGMLALAPLNFHPLRNDRTTR